MHSLSAAATAHVPVGMDEALTTLPVRNDARNPLYLQAKCRLRTAILANQAPERLPSERDLARRFGISFMTARRAVSELVDEGLLVRRHGKGTYVCPLDAPQRSPLGIGVVVPPGVVTGTFGALVQALLNAARDHAHATVSLSSRIDDLVAIDPGRPRPRLSLGGVILLGLAAVDAPAAILARRHGPVVLVEPEADEPSLAAVSADHFAGGRLAVEHLLGLGHRRIAFLGVGAGAAADRCSLGYRSALRRIGVASDDLVAAGGGIEAGYAATGRLLAGRLPPTALVCADDAIAAGAMRRLGESSRRIGSEVSIIACAETAPAAFAPAGLSTVAAPVGELARAAVARLLDLGSDEERPERMLVGVALHARGSSGAVG